jgi:hypothetical protein
MRLGTEVALRVALQGMGFSGRLNTACLERVDLTGRHGRAALARRTWATAKPAPHLLAHLQWWRAYYHVVRPHAAQQGKRTDGGQQGMYPRAPSLRLPLESHSSQSWLHCHAANKTLKVPAEDVGWGLTAGREGLSGLPTDEKPARKRFGEAGGILHHVRWQHPTPRGYALEACRSRHFQSNRRAFLLSMVKMLPFRSYGGNVSLNQWFCRSVRP